MTTTLTERKLVLLDGGRDDHAEPQAKIAAHERFAAAQRRLRAAHEGQARAVRELQAAQREWDAARVGLRRYEGPRRLA